MNAPRKELKSIYASFWRGKRIVFRYSKGRWGIYEAVSPWEIGEALSISLQKIEEAFPGSLEKAAQVDDKNWQCSKSRSRRYIAESPDLLYIASPHLKRQSVAISGFHVVTNISWAAVPNILRLVCDAAGIEYGNLSNISF